MTVDLWIPAYISWLAKAKNQRCMLSATKPAMSIKLANGRPFVRDLDLDFANVYIA